MNTDIKMYPIADSINGLQTALCQALAVPIPAVGWTVGMYEMPQCTARGIPLCNLKDGEVFKLCFTFKIDKNEDLRNIRKRDRQGIGQDAKGSLDKK